MLGLKNNIKIYYDLWKKYCFFLMREGGREREGKREQSEIYIRNGYCEIII